MWLLNSIRAYKNIIPPLNVLIVFLNIFISEASKVSYVLILPY